MSAAAERRAPLMACPAALHQLPAPLLAWYDTHQRGLPWRQEVTPYRTWVSEIMLQQTRVNAAVPYFLRFMEAFPTVEALASADTEKVLSLWQGLGYYRRARHLQEAARMICERWGGRFPASYEEIMLLPGIGDYTAGAILSIAFGQAVPAVDGNVLRVVSRITGFDGNVLEEKHRALLRGWTAEVLPSRRPGAFNQALMDLGAGVCVPNGQPQCEDCPARDFCAAHQTGRERSLPVREKNRSKRTETLTVFLLQREGRTALRRRAEQGLLAGLWEYPHTPGHLEESAAAQWLSEQGVVPHRWIKRVKGNHEFTHIRWEMTGYIVEVMGSGSPDWVWCDPAERQSRAIPSAFGWLTKETE